MQFCGNSQAPKDEAWYQEAIGRNCSLRLAVLRSSCRQQEYSVPAARAEMQMGASMFMNGSFSFLSFLLFVHSEKLCR